MNIMKKVIIVAFTFMLLISAPLSTQGATIEDGPKLEIIDVEDGPCTARIIEPDGKTYEATADTCLEAVLTVIALKKADE